MCSCQFAQCCSWQSKLSEGSTPLSFMSVLIERGTASMSLQQPRCFSSQFILLHVVIECQHWSKRSFTLPNNIHLHFWCFFQFDRSICEILIKIQMGIHFWEAHSKDDKMLCLTFLVGHLQLSIKHNHNCGCMVATDTVSKVVLLALVCLNVYSLFLPVKFYVVEEPKLQFAWLFFQLLL